MTTDVRDLIDQLQVDPWREKTGFSADIETVHDRILKEELPDSEVAIILNDWLAKNQPCLFGKIGARLGLISYCIFVLTN